MIFMVHGACGYMGTEMIKQIRHHFPDAEIVPVDSCQTCADVYQAPSEYRGRVDCIVDFSHHSATKKLTDYAVAVQAVAKIPIGTGKIGADKNKIHSS